MKTISSQLAGSGDVVLPAEVLEKLGVKPGDTLRFLTGDQGGLIVSARESDDDPFVSFTEWESPEDEEAFKDL